MTLGWENPAQPVVSTNLFDCVAIFLDGHNLAITTDMS